MSALTVFFFWPLITPDATARRSFVLGDFTDQFLPFHTFAANELAAGRIATWDPYMYSGYPFQADIQTAVLYPISFLNEWLNRGSFTLLALEWEAVVHFALAAAFTFLLIRLLTRSTAAGILGAVTFTFGGFLTSYPDQQLPVLESTVWLPLELYCIERAAISAQRAASTTHHSSLITHHSSIWLALAGACVGLAVLAGHPQTVLYLAYAGAAYLLFRLPWKAWWKAIWPVLSAGGLSAVQLLPSAQLFAFNHKGRLDYGFAAGGITAADLPALLTNNPPGGRILYLGIVPLLLAAAAVIAARNRFTTFWLVVAVLSLLLSLGTHGPLFRLFFDFVPGWDLFRDQERAVVLFAMAGSILAGYGLAWVCARAQRFGARGRGADTGRAGAGLAAGISAILVLATFTNLWLANRGNNLWIGDSEQDFKAPKLVQTIRQDPDVFRVRLSEESLSHNSGNVLNLQVVSGNSPFELESFKKWTEDGPDGNRVTEWQLLQLTNAHYIISNRALCGDRCQAADGIQLLGTEGRLYLFKILYPLPRAFFVTNAAGVATERQAIDGINGRDFDARKLMFLQGKPAHSSPFDETASLRADVVGYAPRLVDVRTSSDRPAYLFTSEIAYPAWEATIDGRPAPILVADGIFRALDVPPGQHHIVFQYVPRLLFVGGAISILTLLLLAAAALRAGRRRPQPAAEPD